jgi:aspartyl-tRNA(Asn)/glutamyl-tRNA(Gln) amidotransferase subunit A
MYLNDLFTIPASMAGMPGMSVPVGLNSEGLPIGLQLIGKPFEEAALLQAAHALEQQAQFTALPHYITARAA